MNRELREKAVKLRQEQHLSYTAIRKKLGVPKSTLSGWLRDYPLSEDRILELRRKGWQKGEASRERYRNTMRAKKQAQEQAFYATESKKLCAYGPESRYTAGLLLYAAEGTKKDPYRINIANTDPAVIRFFVKWLDEFFNIPKEQLKFQLHLYENMNITKETRFWMRALGIKESQLYKSQVRKLAHNSFVYRESFRHGTCSIYFSDRDKKMRLTAAIKAFFDLHST